MNKCCEKCWKYEDDNCFDRNCPCHSQEKEETTTSQAILLDMYEREGLVGIEKHIAKERTQAYAEGKAAGIEEELARCNKELEKLVALLPEQESK